MGLENVFHVQAVMSLMDHLTGPLKKVQGELGATERSANRLSGRLGRLSKAMMPLVAAAGLLVGAFGVCVGATLETQAALGELASVGITDMEALSSAAEDFSGTWAGTTKPEFISAAYDIKSGISSLTDEGVAAFTQLAALTGKATKSTTAEMTSLFATGYGIYKGMYADLSDMEFGEVFSAGIAASVQAFKTSGSGMAQAISTLGATATSAQVPLEEQLAILGMLQATMTGSEAGTKYKAMMKSAAGAGQKLGLQFMDSNNQLLAMPDILSTLKGKYGATLDAVEKMELQKAFGTEEAVAVIDLLYGKIDDLSGNIDALGGTMQEGSAFTGKMADTMNRDLGSVLQLIGQRFHNLKEAIGNVFLPVVIPVAVAVGGLIGLLTRLAKTPVGRVMVMVAGGVAVATLAFAAFAAAGALLGVVVPFVTASLVPLGAAVAAIGWPVWLIVAAVGVLALAWKRNFGGMADVIGGWWQKITLVVRGVKAVFETLTGTVGTIEGELAGEIRAAGLVGLVTTVAKVIYRIRELFAGLWGGFASAMGGVVEIFMPVITSLADAFRPLFQIIGAVAGGLKAVAGAFLGASAASDASGWRTLGAIVGVTVGSAFQLLAWAIRIAITPLIWIAELVGFALDAFVGLGRGIGTAAGWIVAEIGGMADWIGGAVDRVLGLFGGLYEAIKWVFLNLTPVGWLVQAFSGISGILDGVGRLFNGLYEAIKWVFLNLTPVGWLVQAFAGITGFFDRIDLAAAGAKIMRTLAAGIKRMVMAPIEAVKGAFSKIRNLLPFSDAKEGPLSSLTLSGGKIMETLAAGVRSAAPALQKAAAGALGTVAVMAASPAAAAPAGVQMETPQAAAFLPLLPDRQGEYSRQAQPVASPEIMGRAQWQPHGLQVPGMPDLSANASWQAQPVPSPVAPDLTGWAEWQSHELQVPGVPDLMGRAEWQSHELQVPGVPDLMGRAEWQSHELQVPGVPDLMGRAGWQPHGPQVPEMPDFTGRAQWRPHDMQVPEMPDLAGAAHWVGQPVAAPAIPDLTGQAVWQASEARVPDLPDLAAAAAWQAEAVPEPVLPDVAPPPVLFDAGGDQEGGAAPAGGRDRGERRTVVQQMTVNLPNVTDGKSFWEEMAMILEGHDV